MSKSYEGTESCNFIGYVVKRLFMIKVSQGSKSPPLPDIGLILARGKVIHGFHQKQIIFFSICYILSFRQDMATTKLGKHNIKTQKKKNINKKTKKSQNHLKEARAENNKSKEKFENCELKN